ncbi:MAG TPA: hypothetical protein VIQ29_18205 [Ancylobacter sp.]
MLKLKALPKCFPDQRKQETTMFKGGLLWLIGIPLPIVIGLWLFGYLS